MTYAVGYEDCLEKHKHEKKSLWAIITSGGDDANHNDKREI